MLCVRFAPYDLSRYHFFSFASRVRIHRAVAASFAELLQFGRIVIVWQNSYSFTEQLARDVNRFEQTLFAFAGCQHQPANLQTCPFDPVVLMADARACWADGTTHRARIRWDSHETNTFAEKRTQLSLCNFHNFQGFFDTFHNNTKPLRGPVKYSFADFSHCGKKAVFDTGVSILSSQGQNPPYVKLPIFSEFMENSTKFMKNSKVTKWTKNLRQEDQNRFQGPGVHCLKIEATHQINVFTSVFSCIGDHIWQKHCLSFINI